MVAPVMPSESGTQSQTDTTARIRKPTRFLISLGLALTLLPSAVGIGRAAETRELSPAARQQIRLLQDEKAARGPAQRKMDSQLNLALRQHRPGLAAPGLNALQPQVRLNTDGRLLVDLRAAVTPSVLEFIERNGGQVVNSFAQHNAIRALVPLELLEPLAARPDVRSLRPADEAITNVGAVNSGGDIAHRANQVRSTYGVDGSGIKIGVLSDSVDYLTQSQAAGELPAVTILPGQAGFGTGEGTAMLEIIHDLAPGAELYFATAFNGVASFAQNIRALHAVGCRIIVDDVVYFVESPLQDGPISQAVNDISAAGALFFSSAGNGGSLLKGTSGTWEGDFKDGGPATLLGAGRLHDFGRGITYNTVLPGGGLTRLDLFWADPLGASTNDYDVFVLNSADQVVRSSTNVQDGDDDPYESISFLGVGERIVIVKNPGSEDRFLSLMTLRGRLAIATPGSVRGHNASGANNAFSVAAVRVSTPPAPFDTFSSNEVEPFSSDGPRRMFFHPDGSAITPGDFSSTGGVVLEKPDLTAANGVATSVPGFANFLGTSAAAPHAAAIAALLWSHKPELTPAEVRAYLTVPALDIESPGVDRNSGAGIVMADQTFEPTPRLTLQVVQLDDGNGNGGLDANECVDLLIALENVALPITQVVTGITAVLKSLSPAVTADPLPRSYANLAPGGRSTNALPFRISTGRVFDCGTNAQFLLQISTSNHITFSLPFQLQPSAAQTGAPRIYAPADLPAPIPDLGTAESVVLVAGMDQLLKRVRVAVHLTHSFDYDLRLSLVSPDGTEVVLSSSNGGGGEDYGSSCEAPTVFADDAVTNIADGSAPFVGVFRPQQPLTAFEGKSGDAVNGLWKLRVEDQAAQDSGVLLCWALELSPLDCEDDGGECLVAPVIVEGPASQVRTEGEVVQFSVLAQGTAPLAYQWFFTPTNSMAANSLPVATNASLAFTNVTPANAGTYSVLVTNLYGQTLSSPATLAVQPQPLLVCPTNRSVEWDAVWEFDEPQVFGDGTTVTVLNTVTNVGCGLGYFATRTWQASDTNGLQASCSQTITVLDTRAPTITCVPDKTVPLGTDWTFDPPSATAAGAVAAIVYDNALNDLLYRYDPGLLEVGDEIILEGPAAQVAQFAFEFWGFGPEEGDFAGNVEARLRFYRNDGPLVSGYASPGTLIFDSGSFPIPTTPRAVVIFEDFHIEVAVPLTEPLPESFTWTVQFSGLAEGDSTGLDLYSPPVTGNNYTDYWERDGEGWVLKTNAVASMDFAARLIGLNRGVVITELATVTNPPVAINDNYRVAAGGVIVSSARGVLGNDHAANGTGLLAVLENTVRHGTLNLNPDGSFVYTPAVNYGGPDSFTYRAVSAGISSVPATVSLIVVATDTTPPTAPENLMANATSPHTVQLAWDDVTDDVAVDEYLVSRDGTLLVTLPGWQTRHDDTDLAPATAYVYEVVARDAAGNLSPAASVVVTTPPAALTAVVRVNTGGDTFVDDAGHVWSADFRFNTGQTYWSPSAIAATENDTLYQTERYDVPAAPALTYSFSLTNGNYTVKLHFAEIWSGAFAAGARVFDVWVEEELRVEQLDIFAEVGANTALVLELPVSLVDGQLDITFGHVVQNPKISALEVLVAQTVTDPPVANTVPVAVPDSYSLNQGDVLVVAAPGLLLNDTDADGDRLAAVLETDVQHGELKLNWKGSFVYTPHNDYSGSDSFSYRATDGISNSAPVVVSLNVIRTAPGPNMTMLTRSWEAVDECGNRTTCSQTVTIEDLRPPQIVVEPLDQIILAGGDVEFTLTATGAAPLSYQWYFKESPLPEANEPALRLTSVQLADAGAYFARVGNAFGMVTSTVVTLTVWEPPVIIEQPASLAVEPDQTAVFNVTAIGTEPLSYQWFFGTTLLPDATDSALVLEAVQPAKAGGYSVVVTNVAGTVTSQVAVLFVGFPGLLCAADRTVELGASWDFTLPLTFGDDVTLQVLSTVTNAGCGEGYQATRTWLASKTNGQQSTCSQTVVVLDTRPPILVCVPDKTVPLGGSWTFDPPTALAAGDTVSLVYDNSVNDLLYRFDPGTLEVGDEIILDGPANHLRQFIFEFWGVGPEGGDFAGDVQARVRFYENDGPLSSGYPSPGTVLFDSGPFSIPAVPRATVIFDDFQTDAPVPLSGPLPEALTWTVQFSGMAEGDRAGLDLYSPPVAGQNYNDYWERENEVWVLKTNAVAPMNFAARFAAVSRGVTVTELVTLTNPPVANTLAIQRTWLATDDCGNHATCSQTVFIEDTRPPLILEHPEEQTVNAGDTVAFEVIATGAAPLHYQWRFNQTNLLPGATGPVLELSNVQATNNGLYAVVVSNPFGAVTSTVAVLNVFSAPWIVAQPADLNVSPGDPAFFSVQAAAYPPPDYQWFFNETNLLADATDAVLTIPEALDELAGLYSVVVTNDLGSITSRLARLTLGVPAFVSVPPQSVTVTSGGTALFAVVGGGTPPLSYQWYFNCNTPLPGATEAILELTNVNPAQSGQYCVLVSNRYGAELSLPVSLRVLTPPDYLTLSRTGTIVTLEFSTLANQFYTVQFRDDLRTAEWSALRKGSNRPGTGLPMILQDPQATGPHRFYRILIE